jgi:hypothetical protein
MAQSVLTVGTGKTYSNWQDAVTAAATGDVILIYAGGTNNVYTQYVNCSGKWVNIIGMVANQGITLKGQAGYGTNINLVGTMRNIRIEGVADTGQAVNFPETSDGLVSDCIFAGYNKTGIGLRAYAYGVAVVENCLFYGWSSGVYFQSTAYPCIRHCTAVKNTYGFNGLNGAQSATISACLAAGNDTKDFWVNGFASRNCFALVSGDTTAIGQAPVTGFSTDDFVDYANGDYRLKSSCTSALFQGEPLTQLDFYRNLRRQDRQFYAGHHDPVPANYTDPGEANVVSGTSYYYLGELMDGAYTPDFPAAENVAPDDTVDGDAGTMDLPALSSVDPADTLRGTSGTLDLPALNKVAPSDTLKGSAGTLDLPALNKVAPSDTLEGVTGTLDLPAIASVLNTDTLEGVTGEAIPQSQAATPTGFSLASSLDGLTHTLAFTSTETAPTAYIHDASHNVAATGINSEKIRGLTNGATYHIHVLSDGKSLSSASSTATAGVIVANYGTDAGNIKSGAAIQVDGSVTAGTGSATAVEFTIPAPIPVALLDTDTVIYECPAGYVASVKQIRVCNTNNSTHAATLYKVKAGESSAYYNCFLKTRDFYAAGIVGDSDVFGPFTLSAGDKLIGFADDPNVVTVTCEAVEVTA